MLHTPICDYFGIKYPILLAGMGGVAMHKLVAAVSNAGGLGVLGAASLSPDDLRTEIRKIRELTDKPFAVDLLAPIPDMMRPHVPVMIEEKIKIFVAGLSVPQEFVKVMHDNGMKIVVMCGKVHHGVKSQDAGADVVVAQGTEAGGHTGEIGMLSLVPQMIDAVRLPVLAAGGIADGRQIAAALTLGAQGVVIGTRFIATPEAQAAAGYREAIVKAHEDSTMRTRAYTGKTCRVIRTEYALEWEKDPSKIQPFPMQAMTSQRNGVMNFSGLRGDGFDPNRTFMPTGQGAGLIHEIKPTAEVFADLLRETEAALRKSQQLLSGDPVRQHSASPARQGCQHGDLTFSRKPLTRREPRKTKNPPAVRSRTGFVRADLLLFLVRFRCRGLRCLGFRSFRHQPLDFSVLAQFHNQIALRLLHDVASDLVLHLVE